MTDAAAAPTPAQVDHLRTSFGGEVITPDHASYDDARRVWNAVFDRHPAFLVRPSNVADVAAAIRFGRETGLEIAVRSGGHSASGHSTCEGGLVIDLSKMRGVSVDPDARIARANGGALLGELDIAAQGHGLVCPVGVIGHTGVAGLTLGGGVGRLQRHFGLTIDNLRSVELVTADGRLIRASETEEPELFWGVRGAGANFGVVTSFELGLHEFGPLLHRGARIYPAGDVHEVWAIFREFSATAPDAASMILAIGMAQPASDYPDAVAGKPIVIVGYNHSGSVEAAERDMAPLSAGPTPVSVSGGSQPYLEVQVANDEAMGWGSRLFIGGGYANDVGPEVLDALVEHVTRAPGDSSFSITAQGGAIGRVAEDATAFTGRYAPFDVSADSAWTDPSLDDANAEWVRQGMAIFGPDMIPGRYANENSDFGPAETRAIYGDAKMARLEALKRAWDPDNVFHLNHNIVP